jgi:cardiolipin hydrolase
MTTAIDSDAIFERAQGMWEDGKRQFHYAKTKLERDQAYGLCYNAIDMLVKLKKWHKDDPKREMFIDKIIKRDLEE